MGSGSWGTAFAATLADAGTDVRRLGTSPGGGGPDQPGQQRGLPARHTAAQALRATTDAEAALADRDLVMLAVPSQALRDNLKGWTGDLIPADATLGRRS